MANRTHLCIAGLLLLLSLLQTSESVYILAIRKMTELGEDALTHLKTEAALVLRNHTGAHSFGCIEEPKENERLNCSHISTFSFYLQAATNLDGLDEKLNKTLLSIRQHVEDLRRNRECSSNSTNTCESAFHSSKKASRNAEKLRSLLELFVLWINKHTKA